MGTPPDVLWIVTTQWRAQACGYAGDYSARTPALDVLAARGVNYAQAVTPHPFGPFARAALLTGVPSPENGVRDYFDPLPADSRTIAHEMADRGYATAWFGKWHLWKRDPAAPLVGDEHARIFVPPEGRGGFEFWEGFESGFVLNDPWLHGSRLPRPTRFLGYQPDVLVDRAQEWWESRATDLRPWFCVMSLETPHPPYDAPAGLTLPLAPEDVRVPPNVPAGWIEDQVRRDLAGYYAHIAATDRAIGRLLEAVRRTRRGAGAIVVFTSVHGDLHGAHGFFRKGWPFEESIRVPFLVQGAPVPEREPDHGPGERRRPARISNEPVTLLDLPAMTLAWIEGRPWQCPREHAFSSMPTVVKLPHNECARPWRAVRTRAWKAVFSEPAAGAASSGALPWLIYDLTRDPYEMRNLLRDAEAGPILAAARVLMAQAAVAEADAPGTGAVSETAEPAAEEGVAPLRVPLPPRSGEAADGAASPPHNQRAV